jgi:hypothetical protein
MSGQVGSPTASTPSPAAPTAPAMPAAPPKPAVSPGNWKDIDVAANSLAAAETVAHAAELLGYHIRKTTAYQVAENNFSLTTTFSQFPPEQIEDHLANLDPAVRAQVQAVRQWQVLEWAAKRALKADEARFGAIGAKTEATQRGPELWLIAASNATSALATAIHDTPFNPKEIRKHFGGENAAFRNKIEEALLEALPAAKRDK